MRKQGSNPFSVVRFVVIAFISSAALGLLVFRLWYLQGVKGTYFRDLSENNRTRTVRTTAPRGRMFDRDGKLLVGNRPAFDIALLLEDISNLDSIITGLSEITGRDEGQLRESLNSKRGRQHFEPRVIISDVSREELARIKVHAHKLPGVIVNVTPTRMYPFPDSLPHVSGYVRQITKSQLEQSRGKDYHSGDMTGQNGLEKQWESALRGKSGYVRVEVDAHGHRRGELGIVDALAGRDLYLTLDMDLQRVAKEALAGQKGAVVALDPRSGEILALTSAPSFDANVFSGEVSVDTWQGISRDTGKPLTNRTIGATYAPGSTFKLIMAMAGLAEKKITPTTEFDCPGYYLFKGRRYHCHKRAGHGVVNLKKAIAVSCDSYFYQLGNALGITLIHKYATMFGMSSRTGVELPGEKRGIVPSKDWKLKYVGERWYKGETLSVSIGQGFLTATPIQMAAVIATLGNNGTFFRPVIVKKVVNRKTLETEEFLPQGHKVSVGEEILALVRDYAREVVHGERGTGKRSAIEGIYVAGKTGTSQVVSLGKQGDKQEYKDHGWFVSFAPFENPTIAIAVIVENGGHGGVVAAPISKKVMEVYFRKQGIIPPEEVSDEDLLPLNAASEPGDDVGAVANQVIETSLEILG